jgi:hypothetical protein
MPGMAAPPETPVPRGGEAAVRTGEERIDVPHGGERAELAEVSAP